MVFVGATVVRGVVVGIGVVGFVIAAAVVVVVAVGVSSVIVLLS